MIDACRICGSGALESVLNMGEMAFSGIFPKPGDTVPAGRINVVRCGGCGLAQLSENLDLDMMYGDNYGYRSGLNRAMVDHLEGIAEQSRSIVGLDAGDVVVDIGSNDGTLLGHFPNSLTRVGIDPTSAKFAEFYKPGIIRIPEFFSPDAVMDPIFWQKAKVVTSIACLYDLEDPVAFAREVGEIMDPEGIWIFEQAYLPSMIEQNAYDGICHEHLEYYGMGQIEDIVGLSDLKVIGFSFNDCNGGSFRVIASHLGSSYKSSYFDVKETIRAETEMGFSTSEPLQGLDAFRLAHRDKLRNKLSDLKKAGKRVYGYGASTKGNIVLQNCGIDQELLEGILEINPDKFGRVTPGTNIPIVSEAPDADVFMVLPWHFREGIIAREKAFLGRGGALLFPLPCIEMVYA